MLSVKTKESNELQHRCGEMEKMLEEKDEEIIELMRDYNEIQEHSEQKQTLQKPSLQLLSIPEETSSVTDQDFEEIKSPTEVNKH